MDPNLNTIPKGHGLESEYRREGLHESSSDEFVPTHDTKGVDGYHVQDWTAAEERKLVFKLVLLSERL
jgi:hypothetical protein